MRIPNRGTPCTRVVNDAPRHAGVSEVPRLGLKARQARDDVFLGCTTPSTSLLLLVHLVFWFSHHSPQYNPVPLATAPHQIPTSGQPGDARCTGVPCPAELPRYF
eukprot:145922-Rhodomonas_salina.1